MKPSTGAAVRDHRNVFQSEQVSAIVGIRNSVRAELKGAAWLKKARIRECGRREKQHRCRRDDAEPHLSCHTSLFSPSFGSLATMVLTATDCADVNSRHC